VNLDVLGQFTQFAFVERPTWVAVGLLNAIQRNFLDLNANT